MRKDRTPKTDTELRAAEYVMTVFKALQPEFDPHFAGNAPALVEAITERNFETAKKVSIATIDKTIALWLEAHPLFHPMTAVLTEIKAHILTLKYEPKTTSSSTL